MSELHSSRRDVMRALAFLPAAISVPAAAQGVGLVCAQTLDPARKYLAIEAAFNNGGSSEEEFTAALDALDDWQPRDATGFLRKFIAMFGDNPDWDGFPSDHRLLLLFEDARRLAGRA
ncbi:hypothetical protein [Sphingobium ummariense]|uniref:Uncharacterized protein n=1 Tax=Sphingobium ummariense RL-3 TaxID=1346791 RepID=T0KFR7_9SPHN|nr:hypothetical protein [Sphingobium ummariense]EQB32248.1 hypothetical protein M529_10625 [Sphingobium ummariense RL-3]